MSCEAVLQFLAHQLSRGVVGQRVEICQDVVDFVGLALPLELLAALPPVLCLLCTTAKEKKNRKVFFQDFFFRIFFNWDFVGELASRFASCAGQV